MRRYHFRFWSGPTAVSQMADMLRTAAMPWQHVTIEGTEHIHCSIDALHSDAVIREIPQWFNRSNLSQWANTTWEMLRTEDI